ncbi:hypothetical protein VII_001887 [Vibrio mimicus MB451]|nr:hypothetical protein VII_001887 [Vibrio mimicus MB451]
MTDGQIVAFQLGKGFLNDLLSTVLLSNILRFFAGQKEIETIPQNIVIDGHRMVILITGGK